MRAPALVHVHMRESRREEKSVVQESGSHLREGEGVWWMEREL